MFIEKNRNLILKNRRYFYVLLVLVFAFYYGKNLDNKQTNDKVIRSLTEEIEGMRSGIALLYYKDDFIKNDYLLAPDNQPIRVIFQSEYRMGTGIELVEDIREANLNLSMFSNHNEEIPIKTFKLVASNGYYWNEVVFHSKNDFKNLKFNTDTKSGYILIKNVRMTVLDNNSLQQIRPTIFGQMEHSLIREIGLSEEVQPIFQFNRRNETFGQIVKAETDNISSVSLRIKIKGNGGIGNYRLELKKATLTNEGYQIKGNILSSFYIDAAELSRYLEDGEVDTYNFPLPAFLDQGNYYFIGLNNSAVKFNTLNYMTVLGSKTKTYQDGFALTYIGEEAKKSGELYIKLFGKKPSENKNERILTDTIVEDLGNGHGQFSFDSNGTLSDFLNINKINATDPNKVFYDPIQKGVSGTATNDTSFEYKFNTIYPYSKLSFEFTDVGGEFNKIKPAYSLDEVNWHEVIPDIKDPNIFKKVVGGNGNNTILYIKISYESDPESPQQLFGLKKIKIRANLLINSLEPQ